jgi:hypothetical protein
MLRFTVQAALALILLLRKLRFKLPRVLPHLSRVLNQRAHHQLSATVVFRLHLRFLRYLAIDSGC